MMRISHILSATLAALFLAACRGGSGDAPPQNKQASARQPPAPAKAEPARQPPKPAKAEPARQPPRPAKAETAAPLQKGIATAPELSAFKDFNAVHREKAITYWFIANYPGELWIEKAMDLLSAKYYNEYDFFKRQDMLQSEWPKYQQELAAYKGMEYVYIPLGEPIGASPNSFGDLYAKKLRISDYDSQRKGFLLTAHHDSESCLGDYHFRNLDRVKITFHSDVDCFLPMEDEAQVRKFADAWSSPGGSIYGFGRLYLRLSPDSGEQEIRGDVVAAEVQWRAKGRPGEPVPEVQLRTLMKSPQYRH